MHRVWPQKKYFKNIIHFFVLFFVSYPVLKKMLTCFSLTINIFPITTKKVGERTVARGTHWKRGDLSRVLSFGQWQIYDGGRKAQAAIISDALFYAPLILLPFWIRNKRWPNAHLRYLCTCAAYCSVSILVIEHYGTISSWFQFQTQNM